MKKLTRQLLTTLLLVLLVCTILPASAMAASTSISAKKLTLIAGESKTIRLKNNKKPVVWSISNTGVTSRNSKSLTENKLEIIGYRAGTSTITAKVGKKKYTCKVTVKNAPKISKTKLSMPYSSTAELTVTGTCSRPKWSTSNKNVVDLYEMFPRKYKLIAKNPGTATIKAVVNKKTLTCKVTVGKRPTSYGDTSNYNKNYKGNFDPRDVKTITTPNGSSDGRQVGDVAYNLTPSPEFSVNLCTHSWPCFDILYLYACDPLTYDRTVEQSVYLDPKDISWTVENPDLVTVRLNPGPDLEGNYWQTVNKARGWGPCKIEINSKGVAGSTKVHIYYKGLHWIRCVNIKEEIDPYHKNCDRCGQY